MKKMFTLLIAAMVSLTVASQEEFVPKTAVMQKVFTGAVLDAQPEAHVYNRSHKRDIAIWAGTQVPEVVANFNVSYTADSLYIYSEIRLESTTTTGKDEISMTIGLESERAEYSFDLGEPNDNGFLFSKITFGGEGASAAVAGEVKVRRNVEWIYQEVEAVEVTIDGVPVLRDGYNVEGRIAWNDITTNQTLLEEFRSDFLSGEGSIYFDVAYKFGEEENYVAWSNDDNTAWKSTQKVGVLRLMERKKIETPLAETAPAFDADKDEVYSGEGHVIQNWNAGGEGIAGVSGTFWTAYDSDYLYIYSQVEVPEAEKTATVDEVTITVGVRPADAYLSYSDGEPNENGFLFSKLVFGGDNELIVYTHRGVDWIWRDAEAFDEFEGYILEARVAWNVATTDPEMLARFLERKSFFFDIGYKLKGSDDFYFAWNNRDNMAWRSTYPAGQVFFEGAFPTSVKRIDNIAFDMSVWPNPVSNVLTINASERIKSVEIFSLAGHRVLNHTLADENRVDTSLLKAGVYLLKANFANGNSASVKLIKR